jgi:uncharacterized protein YjiS (DUF1127 family)
MLDTANAPRPPRFAPLPVLRVARPRRIASGIIRLLRKFQLALQVWRERRVLLAMDDRTLKDLGLNGIAYREASRPFWDVPRERLCARDR